KQPAVTIEIDMALHAQIFHALEKTTVPFIAGARRKVSLRSVQVVQVMEFFYWRHPEIGMRVELPIKPRSPGFLCADTYNVGPRIASGTVKIVHVTVMSVALMAVFMVTVVLVTVAGFEWPIPTHRPIFSIRHLKSKPGM